jgi:hypothetical protein
MPVQQKSPASCCRAFHLSKIALPLKGSPVHTRPVMVMMARDIGRVCHEEQE